MDLGNHRRVAMTDNHGAPGADVVDVLSIVFVDQIGAAALLKKDWVAANSLKSADWRVDATGQDLFGCFKK